MAYTDLILPENAVPPDLGCSYGDLSEADWAAIAQAVARATRRIETYLHRTLILRRHRARFPADLLANLADVFGLDDVGRVTCSPSQWPVVAFVEDAPSAVPAPVVRTQGTTREALEIVEDGSDTEPPGVALDVLAGGYTYYAGYRRADQTTEALDTGLAGIDSSWGTTQATALGGVVPLLPGDIVGVCEALARGYVALQALSLEALSDRADEASDRVRRLKRSATWETDLLDTLESYRAIRI